MTAELWSDGYCQVGVSNFGVPSLLTPQDRQDARHHFPLPLLGCAVIE
jgi:hypothetical protein